MAGREKTVILNAVGGKPGGDDSALARIDGLTGLPNRRYFEEQLDREWGRAIRETTPISLLAIAIDGFDAYSEAEGGALLRSAAEAFRQALRRAADFVARRAGCEFAILLPNTDEEGARDIAERVRAGIKKTAGATVSIGITSERPIIDTPPEEFVSKTDNALNAAKESGKNNICIYKDGI
jgi:diguanylate cyclase (GGDEF)-like protein